MDERLVASADGFRTRVLLIAVFTIATCGLVYELLSGTPGPPPFAARSR